MILIKNENFDSFKAFGLVDAGIRKIASEILSLLYQTNFQKNFELVMAKFWKLSLFVRTRNLLQSFQSNRRTTSPENLKPQQTYETTETNGQVSII